MPISTNLIGLGLPPELARRLALDPTTVAGGNGNANAISIGSLNFYVMANAQSSANGYKLPASPEVGGTYEFFNTGAVTCNVWPPTGGVTVLAGNTTATLAAISLGYGAAFVCVSASTTVTYHGWISGTTA